MKIELGWRFIIEFYNKGIRMFRFVMVVALLADWTPAGWLKTSMAASA